MGKPPAFQMYAADFLVDTNDWTVDEVGIYLRLLLSEWVNGGLPNDEKRLSRVVGCDYQKFKKKWSRVSTKFILNGSGLLINKRLESEREKQDKYRELQSEKGKMGGRPLKSRSFSGALTEQKPEESSSSSSSSSNSKDREEDVLVFKKKTKTSYPADNEFILSLKDLYPYIDINQEQNKMKAWLMTPKGRGRQLNRRFIVNWLNKMDKPISTGEVMPINEQDKKSWEIKKALDKIKWKEKDEHSKPT